MAQSGKAGDVKIGSDYLSVKEWTVDDQTDLLDSTTKSSDGKREKIAGLSQLTGTFTGFWDADLHAGDPPLVSSGASANLTFELTEGGAAYLVPTGILGKVSIKSPVDGIVEYTCDWESSGDYTLPTA